MALFLVHERTNREYEVVGLDKETNTLTLKCSFGTFTEKFDKDNFKKWGYNMVKRD